MTLILKLDRDMINSISIVKMKFLKLTMFAILTSEIFLNDSKIVVKQRTLTAVRFSLVISISSVQPVIPDTFKLMLKSLGVFKDLRQSCHAFS